VGRRVPAGSFARLSSVAALWRVWVAYRHGQRRRRHVAAFDVEADRHLFALHRELVAGRYRPGRRAVHVLRDPKPRLVVVAPVVHRVLEQSLVADLAPTYERGFLDQSFACRTGRGPLRAVWLARTFLRRHRWRLHLDVRGYFAHVDHRRLLRLYARRLRDARTLDLIETILAHGARIYQTPLGQRVAGLGPDHPAHCGLPVGSLLSHFSGALYLDGLDHYVKRELKVPGYLRFMDDLLLAADDREALRDAGERVRDWLSSQRDLALKPDRQGVVSTRANLVVLGHLVTRAGITPARTVRRRARRRLAERAREGPEALARTLASYRAVFRTP